MPATRDLIIIMGVCGAGKSTIAAKLTKQTGWPYLEGDDFHPPANIAKQESGAALDNNDRAGWITAMADAVNDHKENRLLLACSALNTFVRSNLESKVDRACTWIHIDVPEEVLRQRVSTREGHFMPPDLLAPQLDIFEIPKDAHRIDGTLSVAEICDEIRDVLEV